MPSVSDESLLDRFLRGDRRALGELADRYEGPLLGLARALFDGNADMASDAIQETWLRVIRHGARFRGRSGFKTWLYRIAINQCRSVKSRAARSGPRAFADLSAVEAPALPAPSDEDRQHLRDVVRSLSPDRRIILLLCYHDGMTNEQAAEILGLPVGTLKTRLRAAMTELRARLHAEAAP